MKTVWTIFREWEFEFRALQRFVLVLVIEVSSTDMIIVGRRQRIVSVMQSWGMCFADKCVRSVISTEATRVYTNGFPNKLGFRNMPLSGLSRLGSRSRHTKSVENLLAGVNMFDAASSTDHSKVSVSMRCNDLHDSNENKRTTKESNVIPDIDISLVCKRYPSISLSCSLPVELYDEASFPSQMKRLLVSKIRKQFLSSSVGAQWVDPDSLCETMSSFEPSQLDTSCSTAIEARSCSLPSSSQPLEAEMTVDSQLTLEESSTGDCPDIVRNTEAIELILDKSISSVPGLTKKQLHQLETCGFHTLRKLLHHFPRTYEDLQNARTDIDDGQYLIFIGNILSSRAIKASYSLSFVEVIVGCHVADIDTSSGCGIDENNSSSKRKIFLHLKKYFRGTRFTCQPFLWGLQGKHKVGDTVCISGKVMRMSSTNHYEMREYNLDVLEDEHDLTSLQESRLYPIYPSKGVLKPDFLRDMISRALESLPTNIDPIPQDVIQDFGLVCLHDAYCGIHHPKSLDEADLARKRIVFDEFFYLQLGRFYQMLEGLATKLERDVLLEKYRKPEVNSTLTEDWSTLTQNFLKALPYSLTSSQLSAASEIIWDLKQPVPMNRLLQGDVGCGKTVVAFLACLEVIGAGYQAAFMAPTELLAVQHYEQLLTLLGNMQEVHPKPSVALLTGSTSSKQSRLIRGGLQAGDISMVIGTHRLIAEKVEFSSLRIAVVDEQQRFGVIQRGRFNSKLYYNSKKAEVAAADSDETLSECDAYMAPHVLAMSATPIPRTLALALYGDMSLTQISDLPPGRIPVETHIAEGDANGFERVYQMMTDELEDGGKIYLVYPVIQQSEQRPQLRAASAEFKTISNKFQGYNCGLLHGRMKSDEKDEALRRFRSGETKILLSTQLIEIGVDVPDASMMVVVNAERFGIAQLHQLRGRVGRGTRKSKCILISSVASGMSRLKVLANSSDCFYLANMDLLIRGPGDLLGKKQSGHLPEFPVGRLEIDGNILQEAHVAALKILGRSHDLEKFPHLKAELSMRQPLSPLGD